MRQILIVLALMAMGAPAFAGDEDDAAVRQAMTNYLDAFYQNKPELLRTSVWEDYRKFGFWHDKAGEPYRGPLHMSYQQLQDLAASWRKDNPPGPDAPREVTVFEVSDQTASGKVEALWGFDYVHLAKFDGTWKIVNIVWQAYPDPGAVTE